MTSQRVPAKVESVKSAGKEEEENITDWVCSLACSRQSESPKMLDTFVLYLNESWVHSQPRCILKILELFHLGKQLAPIQQGMNNRFPAACDLEVTELNTLLSSAASTDSVLENHSLATRDSFGGPTDLEHA